MDDEDDGLLNIEISDDERDIEGEKAKRTGQTEDEFLAVKRSYRPKVENGQIYKHINLPLGPESNKQDVQEVLHAVEELYFFKRYREALEFVKKALESHERLDDDSLHLLAKYETKCQKKLEVIAALG